MMAINAHNEFYAPPSAYVEVFEPMFAYYPYGASESPPIFETAWKTSSYSELSDALVAAPLPATHTPVSPFDASSSENGSVEHDCHSSLESPSSYSETHSVELPNSASAEDSNNTHIDRLVKIEHRDLDDNLVFEKTIDCDSHPVLEIAPHLRSNPRHKRPRLRERMRSMMGIFHADPFATGHEGASPALLSPDALCPSIMTFALCDGGDMVQVEDPDALASVVLGSLLSFDDSDGEYGDHPSGGKHCPEEPTSLGCESPELPYTGTHQRQEANAVSPFSVRHSREKLRSRVVPLLRKETPLAHQCDQCGKAFKRPSGLTMHMHTHSGLKRASFAYACLRAVTGSDMRRPVAFICPVPACGKPFSVRSNARRHYRTHNDGKPDSPPKMLFDGCLPPDEHERLYVVWRLTGTLSTSDSAAEIGYKHVAGNFSDSDDASELY
jgi:hypothetical protein